MSVIVFKPVVDTEAVDENDACDDKDALGELEMENVVVELVEEVRDAVSNAVEETDAEGDEDANDDIEALVDGESRLEEVKSIDALGEPEMVKVIVAVAIAVSVAVFSPVDDTEAEGVDEATNDSDALDVKDSRLE